MNDFEFDVFLKLAPPAIVVIVAFFVYRYVVWLRLTEIACELEDRLMKYCNGCSEARSNHATYGEKAVFPSNQFVNFRKLITTAQKMNYYSKGRITDLSVEFRSKVMAHWIYFHNAFIDAKYAKEAKPAINFVNSTEKELTEMVDEIREEVIEARPRILPRNF
jgi:hypothetical protein